MIPWRIKKRTVWLVFVRKTTSFPSNVAHFRRKSSRNFPGLAAANGNNAKKRKVAITNIRENGSYTCCNRLTIEENGICSVPILPHSTHSAGRSQYTRVLSSDALFSERRGKKLQKLYSRNEKYVCLTAFRLSSFKRSKKTCANLIKFKYPFFSCHRFRVT